EEPNSGIEVPCEPTAAACGDDVDELRQQVAIDLEECAARDPVCCWLGRVGDRVVQARRAPGWSGAWLLGAAAASGARWQQVDACAGELRDAASQRVAERRQFRLKPRGQRLGRGADEEARLELRLVGRAEQLELVGREGCALQPGRRALV